MAKTNFTKAEEALSEALQKISCSALLREADAAQGSAISTDEELKERIKISQGLIRTLRRLHRNDREIYKKVGVKKRDLEGLLENPGKLSKEDWELVLQAKVKADEFLKLLPEKSASDEQLVERERHKHINKRFNVSDKWLPLT